MNSASAPKEKVCAIGVSPKEFKLLNSTLGSKKRVLWQFAGDNFKTKIWRNEAGVLMGTDPKGVRQIMALDENILQDDTAVSLKGFLLKTLVKDFGCDPSDVMEVIAQLKPIIDDVDTKAESLSRDEAGVQKYEEAIRKLVKLAKYLIDQRKEGARVIIVE